MASLRSQIVVGQPVGRAAGWAESAKSNIAPDQKPSDQKKQVGLLSPTHGPACAPQELWLAAHLPQLPLQARGQKILERLATGAQRFTPRVSLAPPDGLLLEVKGSLNLFGGVSGLRLAVAQLHRSAGVEAVLALAPTPLAALARARANQTEAVMDRETEAVMDRAHLVGQVSSISLATLRWPQKVLERLAKTGVYTIGQALRLPRAGFARRFGVAQLASLDRLTGRVADPQVQFHPRERFRRRRELNSELKDQSLILEALEPLLQELERFLRLRQCGITWLECQLMHRHAAPTLCLLRLAAPAADARRLRALLGEKLMALALPEPVRSCGLRTGPIVPRALASGGIWQPGEHGGAADAEAGELVEYLRARLGDAAVFGLQLVADRRPEMQSGPTLTLSSKTREGEGEGMLRRPFWLLHAPKPLSECDNLHLCGTPERIEAGWWDGRDVTRDYYTALDTHGVRYWIFRERNLPHRWFLHGLFG